jgi:hypothetical protein
LSRHSSYKNCPNRAGPVEHNGVFAADKTYILFGMTGDLGISIAL